MGTTWSISRDQVLQTCERKYYFQYLAPAKINSRDETLREIALLKKLKSIPMWQGELFHSLVAGYLESVRRKTPGHPLALLHKVKAKIKREWEESASTLVRSSARSVNAGGNVTLFEHEYNEIPMDVDYSEVTHHVENLFWKFVAWVEEQGLVRSIQQAKNVWIEPQTFGPQAPGFEVDGVKVLIKVDLALLTCDEQFEIFDWKTGALPSHAAGAMSQAEFQVAVYQLWPHLAFHHPLDAIQAHLVYIGADSVSQQTFDIDQNVLAYTLSLVRRSIAQVLFYDNGYQNAELSLDDFDFAATPSACQKCSFKRLCQRTLEI
jgi:PD-(D/E)XK nuclease superfamily